MGKSILQHSEHELLINWGFHAEKMFVCKGFYGLFHVGSSTRTTEYRDVDVRLILNDKDYAKLKKIVDLEYLRLGVSLWGQRATGLPIDFDIQSMTYANTKYPTIEQERHPIGVQVRAIHNAARRDEDELTGLVPTDPDDTPGSSKKPRATIINKEEHE